MDKLEVVEIADAGSLDGDEGDGITRSHGSTRRGLCSGKDNADRSCARGDLRGWPGKQGWRRRVSLGGENDERGGRGA
jgi:hypothetical protein